MTNIGVLKKEYIMLKREMNDILSKYNEGDKILRSDNGRLAFISIRLRIIRDTLRANNERMPDV